MTSKSGNGVVSEFMGEKVNIPYQFTFETFDTPEALKAAGKWPNDADILTAENDRIEAAAKARAYTAAVKTKREEYEKTPAYQRAQFIKTAVATGKFTEESAGALFDSM